MSRILLCLYCLDIGKKIKMKKEAVTHAIIVRM